MEPIVETPKRPNIPNAVCIDSDSACVSDDSIEAMAETLYDLSSLISLMALNASVEASKAGKDEKSVAELVADIQAIALRTTSMASQLADMHKS